MTDSSKTLPRHCGHPQTQRTSRRRLTLGTFRHHLEYAFHDYKSSGIDRDHLNQWCNEHGWQVVLNRAGTTFRKLDDEHKADLDQAKAVELMLAQPSMIKRPVLDLGDKTLIGFKPDLYAAALLQKA